MLILRRGKRGIRGKANCEEAALGTFAIGLSSDLVAASLMLLGCLLPAMQFGLVVIG